MADTTKKHQNFVTERLGKKDTSVLPGITNEVLKDGPDGDIEYAYQIVGKYMLIGKNDTEFLNWLAKYGKKGKYAERLLAGVKEWCEQHI